MASGKVAKPAEEPKSKIDDVIGGEPLSPHEEKMLDRILNGIVIFILAWLGLGVALSVRGLVCSSYSFIPNLLCSGIERIGIQK